MSRSYKALLDAGVRSGHEYLESFLELEEDWDGYGGKPPYPFSVALAHKIMDVVGIDKFVCPDNEGGVSFEWDVDDEGNHLGLVRANTGTYIVSILFLPKDA